MSDRGKGRQRQAILGDHPSSFRHDGYGKSVKQKEGSKDQLRECISDEECSISYLCVLPGVVYMRSVHYNILPRSCLKKLFFPLILIY